MAERPNFLFIITDQQRADHLGCYGNAVIRTPNIDSLADDGHRSEACYVASPICQPNRASIMTGRMPSAHGVRHNGIELDFGETTFVELLRQAGYATGLVGKSHLQNITTNPPHWPAPGEPRFRLEARAATPGRYGQELGPAWEADSKFELGLPYYGFEQVALSINHGDDQFGHYRRWLRAQARDADRLVGQANATPTPNFELSRCSQAWRTRVPEELYPTSWVTEQTRAMVRRFANERRPFFIQCSYPDPHHPFTAPGRYWGMYSPDDVALPASYRAHHRGLPPPVAYLREQRDAGKAVKNTPAIFAGTEREAREAIALNYGAISMIDDGIGVLLSELEKLGLARNTVVVFTSDHADYMGDHQLMLKGPLHYQGLVRVPFIWRDPHGPAGAVSSTLMQTTDLAPTFLDRAGVAPFNGIQGRSLMPVLEGREASVRDDLLIEEEGQRRYMGFKDRIRMRTLVAEGWRLSLYEGTQWGELYDLNEDPDELVNLWDDAGARATRAELTERLARAMLAQLDTSPYPQSLA